MRFLISLLLIGLLSISCNEELIGPQQAAQQANSEGYQEIGYDELPESILDYLEANYPELEICEIEVEDEDYDDDEEDSDDYYYEVLLTNGLELYFDEEGNFLYSEEDDDFEGCDEEEDSDDDSDNDDGDDDDDESGDDDSDDDGEEGDEYISFEDLPQAIQDYLNSNHPDASICEIEIENDEDEDYTYEVSLEGGLELYFDAEGNFLFSEQDDDGDC